MVSSQQTTAIPAIVYKNSMNTVISKLFSQVGYDVFDLPAALKTIFACLMLRLILPVIAEYTLTQLFNVLRHECKFDRFHGNW